MPDLKKIVITSGPTIETIDPIRFISNRSSGKSGLHLANEAKRRGIPEIFFITGPSFYIPVDVAVIKIETALEMRFHLLKHADQADVVIMAAAVGDYRVSKYQKEKIKKNEESLTLQLTRNPDLLLELGRKKKKNQILIGYAAETHEIFENAKNKLEAKNLDLLILNKISPENPAFQVDSNQVYFVTKEVIRGLPRMEKAEIAVHIWDEIFKIRQAAGNETT
ncbi:phosphopantothenoylcysteine decarboxylase [Acidobacteriota bacterium]